ncbi:(S)-benzoin forming benzil reductase [Paenibacillus sp. L3-i20]|uniref:(S)-benzoin forming benzil reductase n=1 Tax=Paenibacillus sp. L3-i20 TaxID=2905833 RepID=UPI001EDF92C4|nr:(S)-benzoin forming benzil reductase [Paenibacillus sp. L3-i20]GKU78890.1 short-chain dehydrogenase [Paenibacillus sp. L3-i20]
MKHFIITGTSRGIGESIAEQLISPDHYLHCISRVKNARLESKSNNITYYEFDLNQIDQIEALMNRIFNSIDLPRTEGIYLINNASMIAPVAFIDKVNVNDLTGNLKVNLLAPIILTSLFIQHTKYVESNKRILNISSSSAKHHHPGMSLYSAAKAGLDVFSQCVGLEQNHSNTPVGIVSIWPGMIDTNLQHEARSQDQSTFPSAELFGMAKDTGMLTTPEETAHLIIDFLFKIEFEHGSVVDIFDYSKLVQQ